jgi:hypothetical protein
MTKTRIQIVEPLQQSDRRRATRDKFPTHSESPVIKLNILRFVSAATNPAGILLIFQIETTNSAEKFVSLRVYFGEKGEDGIAVSDINGAL